MGKWYSKLGSRLKDPAANVAYRREILGMAENDEALQLELWNRCKEDILYFFNAFCFIFEPRPRKNGKKMAPKVLPFITYPHQDRAILELQDGLGTEDYLIEKSRTQGATWIAILTGNHDFNFEDLSTNAYVSRNEDAVYKRHDTSSLLWKFDWAQEQLPFWIGGRKGSRESPGVDWIVNHTDMSRVNLRNGATVVGYAATGEVGSSARVKTFWADEYSKFKAGTDYAAMTSMQATTDCRVFIGTPLGRKGAYYDLGHKESGIRKIVLSWRDNPANNRGLYRMIGFRPVAEDPINNPLPEDYATPSEKVLERFTRLRANGFNLEATTRSPWFDAECDRGGATPQTIAQEYEIDYGGSTFPVFSEEFHQAVAHTTMPPLKRGEFYPKCEGDSLTDWTWEFRSIPDGRMRLWCPLDATGKPPGGKYIAGADVATGQPGPWTSNSAIVIADQRTREQMLEFTTNNMLPNDFADFCIALCLWFNNACLAWERNGPGKAFTKRVADRCYWNFFKRANGEPGFVTDENSKESLFNDMDSDCKSGLAIIHSAELLSECNEYIRDDKTQSIIHAGCRRTTGTELGKNHGDRVIAWGVLLHAVRGIPRETPEEQLNFSEMAVLDAPLGTVAHRLSSVFAGLYGEPNEDYYPTLAEQLAKRAG